MKTALVLMTILGCDDSATECHYIATLPQRWASIELCDSVSEDQLSAYSNSPYPVVVAVCQNPEENATGGQEVAKEIAPPQQNTAASVAVAPKEEEGLATRAIGRVRNILPSTEGVKNLLTKPVRIVEDSYSWVARRFTAE